MRTHIISIYVDIPQETSPWEQRQIEQLEGFIVLLRHLKQQYTNSLDANIFDSQNEAYIQEDSSMARLRLLHVMICDVIKNGYTLEGLASELGTFEDVVFELATGLNTNPSFELGVKLIELHNRVCRFRYQRGD